MKKLFILLPVLFVLFTFWYYWQKPLAPRLKVDQAIFTVEIAATAREKEKGLGYRDSLASNHGMVFPYNHKEQYGYWMRGVRFPLDIIWIADKVVIDITHNVPVAADAENVSQLTSYRPVAPVDMVLEINAGEAKKYGLEAGDSVEFIR